MKTKTITSKAKVKFFEFVQMVQNNSILSSDFECSLYDSHTIICTVYRSYITRTSLFELDDICFKLNINFRYLSFETYKGEKLEILIEI